MADEIDFTFTDDGGLRWRVKSFGNNGEPWLFRPTEDGWVSVRECGEQNILLYLQKAERPDA